ncbi:MAG: ABC transporter permease, partial [Thermoanaerobaculia bacterium]|nr:ABC transporter permease [Thermoanaerobaculia bacterium]
MIHPLLTDLRGGFRALVQNKLVSGLAILSLALAIGGNIGVFAGTEALVERPLPFYEPERLIALTDRDPTNTFGGFADSPANFLDVRRRATSFETLVAYNTASLGLERGGADPEPLVALRYSQGFFETIGWQPALGRLPTTEEEAYGGPPTIVLSNGTWKTRFGGDPSILGSSLSLGGESYEVVGILGPEQEFLSPQFQSFTPLRLDPADARRSRRGLSVLGRLAPGVTLAAADQEMKTLGETLRREHPEANRGYSLGAIDLRNSVVPELNRGLMSLLQAGLLLVLLIACANVANLLLAQAQRRSRELAVRAALGAGRRRLVAQLATESGALAVLSSLLGLGLGWGLTKVLVAQAGANIPQWLRPEISPRVVAFSLVVCGVAAIAFGFAPAIRASRTSLNDVLREGGRSGTGSGRWLAKGLVVAQLVAAMVLLAGSALLVQSIEWLQYASPGFDTQGVYAMATQPPSSRYETEGDLVRFYEAARTAVAGRPGVAAAAFVSSLPRSPFNPTRIYALPGEVAEPDDPERRVIQVAATPG